MEFCAALNKLVVKLKCSILMDLLETLYESLRLRKRPEDIAEVILKALEGKLQRDEKALLERAAANSLKRNLYGYSSMLQEFKKPVGAEKQVKKAAELLKLPVLPAQDKWDDPSEVEAFIASASNEIRKNMGCSSFKNDRLNREQRAAQGLDIPRKRYNKLFRLLGRMEDKVRRITSEYRKLEFMQVAKHGLAHHISWEDFSSDTDTACFIAYYTARCNLRSEFTISGQQRPYDQIAHVLFLRCHPDPSAAKRDTGAMKGIFDRISKSLQGPVPKRQVHTNWWAMAHVYPDTEVLKRLTDEQKGMMLGKWTAILEDIASMLESVWNVSNINRETMIVRRGNDSSTWNMTAGAWNKARDSWMNLIYSMGMEDILDTICFGKALRLMAADVAWWHQEAGTGLDPNTYVWNKLPLPWEVFKGDAQCNRTMVAEACSAHGLDPEKSGWISPRVHDVAEFRATPELVHGVTVENPFLARVLRDHGYFSGKKGKQLDPQAN
jgi:hypothetical protein